MKKNNSFFMYTLCISMAVLLVLLFLWKKNIVSDEQLNYVVLFILIAIIIASLITFIPRVIRYFYTGIRRLRLCGDPLFDEIDYYINHCEESSEHYQNLINAIHFLYRKGGEVDTKVGNDLKRLYKRYDYLNAQLGMKEHFITCLSSVGLSIFASLFITLTFKSPILQIFLLPLMLLFFAVLLLKSYTSTSGESDKIHEYELKLLEKKIKTAEKAALIDYKREDFLLTKQAAINSLIQICKHRHWIGTKDIKEDLHTLEKLNLNLENSEDFKEISFFLGKKRERIVLFVDKENHLANEEYQKLYDILVKYNLIAELPESK